MSSIVEKCTGVVICFYDSETGSVTNDAIKEDEYDFYMPESMIDFKEGDKVCLLYTSDAADDRIRG
jgi:hypothetical protein